MRFASSNLADSSGGGAAVDSRQRSRAWAGRWSILLVLLMGLVWSVPVSATSVSCCSSWAIVRPERHAVIRARVGEPGEVQVHTAEAGGAYRVAPFPLTITDLIKPSSMVEKVGDQVLLWVMADEMYGVSATDPLRDLVGQEAVFLVATTEGQAYPQGYSLYASVSYWHLAEERVTGGVDAIRFDSAPYAELVERVHEAVRVPPRRGWLAPVAVTALLLTASFAVWMRRAAKRG